MPSGVDRVGIFDAQLARPGNPLPPRRIGVNSKERPLYDPFTAERQAAVEFAKAGAIRPRIVGAALQKIARDQDVFTALFDVLETQRIISGEARITLLPQGSPMLAELMAAGGEARKERA